MGRRLEEVSHGRANNIDFLRLCLATAVIWSHSYALLLGSNDVEPVHRLTGGQRTGGELAVDGFFILSGFLIARSWVSSRGLSDYLRRRVLRIYPGFLAAVAFSGLIAGPLLYSSSAEYWKDFSWSTFLLGGANLTLRLPHSSNPVNGSLWSIRYEFVCYLTVAALGLLGVLTRRFVITVAFLGCELLYAGQIYFGLEMPGSRLSWLYCYPGFWPRMMSAFLAGVLFYCYRDRIILSWPYCIAVILGLAFLGVAAPSWHALPLAVPLLGGYLLFFIAYLPMGKLQYAACRGDFSYGLYLYAFPVQKLLVEAFGPRLGVLSFFLAASAITTLLAVASWYFVESPFLRLKRSSRPLPNRPDPVTQPAAPPALSEGG